MDVITGMIERVCSRMAVESATAYILNDALDATLEQVVRSVVATQLDALDETSLRVMSVMAGACRKNGDERMADLVMRMRAEALRQVQRQMPTEVQVLDGLLRLPERASRREMLEVRAKGWSQGLGG